MLPAAGIHVLSTVPVHYFGHFPTGVPHGGPDTGTAQLFTRGPPSQPPDQDPAGEGDEGGVGGAHRGSSHVTRGLGVQWRA